MKVMLKKQEHSEAKQADRRSRKKSSSKVSVSSTAAKYHVLEDRYILSQLLHAQPGDLEWLTYFEYALGQCFNIPLILS